MSLKGKPDSKALIFYYSELSVSRKRSTWKLKIAEVERASWFDSPPSCKVLWTQQGDLFNFHSSSAAGTVER